MSCLPLPREPEWNFNLGQCSGICYNSFEYHLAAHASPQLKQRCAAQKNLAALSSAHTFSGPTL